MIALLSRFQMTWMSGAARNPSEILFACFDVFDTLVTRSVARPADVFLLVAERLVELGLLTSDQAREWPLERSETERRLRASKAPREITLELIARHLARRWSMPEASVQRMARAEMEIERRLIRPLPHAPALVHAARFRGRRVAFVSDMYLPAAFIRSFLQDFGICCPGDPIFVSSECGVTKHSGALFQHVAATLGAAPRAIEHVGDNEHSDFAVPQRLGIRTQLRTETKLNRYEAAIAETGLLPPRTRSLLAGAARLARLGCADPASNHARTLTGVAAGLIGPLTLIFASWALERARALHLRRIFFLSRDGQMPFRIARRLLIAAGGEAADPDGGDRLAAHYLYASRQAWHPAAIFSLDSHDLRWLFADHSDSLTLDRFAERCGLRPNELRQLLPSELQTRMGTRIDDAARAALSSHLQEDTPARARILDRAASYRIRVSEYLRSQGADRSEESALLDIGWNGSLQRSYERILSASSPSAEGCATNGLYFGLIDRPALHPSSRSEAWFVDRARSHERDWLCPIDLLEQFFEADHGTVLGYDESAVPVLKETANTPAMNWGLAHQQSAIERVAEHFLAHARADDIDALADAGATHLVEELLALFMHRPTRDESDCFGAFPKTSSQNHDDARELAPPLSVLHSLQSAVAVGKRHGLLTRWPVGSLVRSKLRWLARARTLRERGWSKRAHQRLQRTLGQRAWTARNHRFAGQR
jgi:FMN phosphatase YigB (HAD superfamily)